MGAARICAARWQCGRYDLASIGHTPDHELKARSWTRLALIQLVARPGRRCRGAGRFQRARGQRAARHALDPRRLSVHVGVDAADRVARSRRPDAVARIGPDCLRAANVRRRRPSRLGFSTSCRQRTIARAASDRRASILRQPVVWGVVVCVNFFALLYQGVIQSPLLVAVLRRASDRNHRADRVLRRPLRAGAPILRRPWPVPVAATACCSRQCPAGGNTVGDCDRLLGQLA